MIGIVRHRFFCRHWELLWRYIKPALAVFRETRISSTSLYIPVMPASRVGRSLNQTRCPARGGLSQRCHCRISGLFLSNFFSASRHHVRSKTSFDELVKFFARPCAFSSSIHIGLLVIVLSPVSTLTGPAWPFSDLPGF